MAFTRVQGTGVAQGTASTPLVLPAFASAPTVGNGILVALSSSGTASSISSVTDNYSNTYTRAGQTYRSSGAVGVEIWSCAAITATGASFTISVNRSASVNVAASALEVSGVGGGLAVDQQIGSSAGAASPANGGTTAALTGPDSFVVAGVTLAAAAGGAITVQSVSPAWVEEFENTASLKREADSRALTGTAGTTVTCSWTHTSGAVNYATHLVAFKATAPPAPTLTSVTPNTGVQGAAVSVTVAGTNFIAGATTVAVSGADVTVSGVSVASATSLTATFTIGGSAATGARNVTVTTAGGTSGAQTFTVTSATPTLTGLSPSTGAQGTAPTVTLTGTNFVIGATTVNVSGTGVTAGTATVASSTSLTVTLTIAGGTPPGARNVTVTTTGGTSSAQTFTVTEAPVTLTIDGRETTDTDLLYGSLRCEQLLDARGRLSCRLVNPPVPPELDMDVLFAIAGTPVFGGIVVELQQVADAWTVTAGDNLTILDGLLINGVSPAGTLRSVLEWFVSVSLGAYDFSVPDDQPSGPTLPALAWPFQTYVAALDQLGVLSGWTWTVSPLRVIRMYPGGTVPAPWDITDEEAQTLSIRQTREGHATHVWVRFGSGPPSATSWGRAGDGVSMSFTPPYYIATPPSVVYVNAVALPLDAYPPSGGWTGWTWETTGSTGVLHAPVGSSPLTASDTLSVDFTAAWPSVAVAVDFTFPLYVGVVVDYPDVFDSTTAQQLAEGELARRQGYPRSFQIRTARAGLQPGQQAAIDVPQVDVDTDALVTGVRLAHAATLQATGEPWWSFQVDLVEANQSRANWLTFWQQKAGGATAGGTGSSITGTIPPTPPGGAAGTGYAIWPLGGDHDSGTPSADWTPIPNAVLVTVPTSFTGRTWMVYVTVKQLLGSGSFQVALTKDGTTTNAGVSTATSASFAALTFGCTIEPGATYYLRGKASDGTTVYGVSGYLEAVQT